MAIDPIWIWVAVGVVAAVLIVALFARSSRRSRSAALKDQFGREYEHAVREKGSRTKAERDLLARTEEVKTFEIRPLNAGERDRYRSEWSKIETRFLERPTTAVVEADELVADIMRVQGYPMGDFEKHAAHLSVKHPRVIDHYRNGHKIMTATPGSSTTEDLRQAMLHYRALFEELVGQGASGKTDIVREDVPRANEVSTTPHIVDERREVPAGRRADDVDVSRRP
ncbi:MAG TPA: hypothetical protein VF618_11610 [Thermoanaerobaculia bacterium]